MAFFSDKKANPNIQGRLDELKPYVIANNVDEIYCSLNEISNEQLKDLVDFADENNKTIKFIPDTKEIFSKNLKIDYYEMFPVLRLARRRCTIRLPKHSLIYQTVSCAVCRLCMWNT